MSQPSTYVISYELIDVETEHEEEDTIALLPNELVEFQQLERNNKPTGEHLQCERLEAATPILPSLFVDRIRDQLPLSIRNEAATPASQSSVSNTSITPERPRRSTREHRQPERFQYFGFGQPAYLRPVFSNFVPAMNNFEAF